MTIDHKIGFWREVIQYAKDRGFDVYWYTWITFVWGTEGNHGITEDGNNRETVATSARACGERLRLIPAGRYRSHRGREHEQRAGAVRSRRLVVEDVWRRRSRCTERSARAAVLPDSPLPTRPQNRRRSKRSKTIRVRWISVSSTRWRTRYSERNPPFIAPVLTEMPDKMRTWLEVRNDDIYSFRSGDPDFARAYINKIPGPDRVAGFNMGPDGGFVAKFGEEATQATPWIPCTMNAAVFSPKPPARAVTTGTAIKAASGVIRLPRIKPSRIAMVAKPRMAGMALVCPDQNSAGRM
jgi:hypothetical protein